MLSSLKPHPAPQHNKNGCGTPRLVRRSRPARTIAHKDHSPKHTTRAHARAAHKHKTQPTHITTQTARPAHARPSPPIDWQRPRSSSERVAIETIVRAAQLRVLLVEAAHVVDDVELAGPAARGLVEVAIRCAHKRGRAKARETQVTSAHHTYAWTMQHRSKVVRFACVTHERQRRASQTSGCTHPRRSPTAPASPASARRAAGAGRGGGSNPKPVGGGWGWCRTWWAI